MNIEYVNTDGAVEQDGAELVDFRRSVEAGLSGTQKRLEAKYFYDAAGSDLFDDICELEEYYPTRTETKILEDRLGELADIVGPGVEVVELGSGSSLKTRHLLSALDQPVRYIPLDISASYLNSAATRLQKMFSDLEIAPLEADFSTRLALPEQEGDGKRVLFFPGSTIGNFNRKDARNFLERMYYETQADYFIIGVDLKKDKATLEAAYDDDKGVTAAFNLNLLTRINRELGGDFDLSNFEHMARYKEALGRVEMHIVSNKAQQVRIGDFAVDFTAGETIHTENSNKYTPEEFRALVSGTGWVPVKLWVDEKQLFSVHLLEAQRF